MRIAVCACEDNLDADIAPRFGRSNFFIFIDPQSLEYELAGNPNINVLGGAGIQSAQFIIGKNIEAVIAGRFGMNALRVLQTAGILAYEVEGGSVKEIVHKFYNEELSPLPTLACPGRRRYRHKLRGGDEEN